MHGAMLAGLVIFIQTSNDGELAKCDFGKPGKLAIEEKESTGKFCHP